MGTDHHYQFFTNIFKLFSQSVDLCGHEQTVQETPDKSIINYQTLVDRDNPRNLDFGHWFMDFEILLWIEDDSGLPTRPLTITKTLKTLNG